MAKTMIGVDIKDLEIAVGVDEAKEILGYRPAKDGEEHINVPGPDGIEKVVLSRNASNRPFSMGLAAKYGDQMFKQEWAGQKNSPSRTSNGETWVIDRKGQIISCAHRAMGLILAEYRRQHMIKMDRKELLTHYGVNGPITLKALVVNKVDPNAADTNDTGKARTQGDVFFRDGEMARDGIATSARKMLCRELAHAVRLVWLRVNGLRVDRGPKLFIPEAVEFLNIQHPLIRDALWCIYDLDGGRGADGKKVSGYCTLGYAAAMLYLAAYGNVSRDKYEAGELDMTKTPKGWAKSKEFWTLFANDLHSEDNPIKALHKLLEKNRMSEQKYERDAVCTLITRAYLAWIGETDKWQNARALGTKLYEKDGDREVLVFERFGGLDLDRQVLRDAGYLQEDEVKRVAAENWKVGDTCWIDQEDGVEPWFGTIEAFSDDGECALVREHETEDKYQVAVSWMHPNKPEYEAEDEPVDAEVVEE